MRKRFFIIALTLAFSALVFADGLKVFSFKWLETDLTANYQGTERRDQNGDKAALIKIKTTEKGFSFEGGSLGIIGTEQHATELWLYVPTNSDKLTISHPSLGILRDYSYPIPIKGGRTYEMLLETGAGEYVTITTSMARSDVLIDGMKWGRAPIYNVYLSNGLHTISAVNDVFAGSVDIEIPMNKDNKPHVINVNMHNVSNQFGDVAVRVVGPGNSEMYFRDEKVGADYWATKLMEGEYTLDVKSSECAECEPSHHTFSVKAQQKNEYVFSSVPKYSVYVKSRVSAFLSEWQKKKEFETTQQWQTRVTEESRNQKVKEQMEIVKQEYIKKFTQPFYATLGVYDADYNLFSVNANGQTLYVEVPLNEAQQFKEKWSIIKATPEYGIVDDYIGIVSCAFNLKKKVYHLKQQPEKENSMDIALDLPPVNFDAVLSPSSSKPKSIAVDRSLDIDIPYSDANNPNTFAVIIGNEKYTQVSQVPFANNDAQIFAEYCKKTLGLPTTNVKLYKNATFGAMIGAISDIQKIAKAFKGDINVIFYYAGHGIPNEATGDAYLLPIDADGLNTEVCYPLTRLYKELAELNVKSVTAFMDACFSGAQRGNGMIFAARGVAIKVRNDRPVGNTVVFTAATDKQTAFPFEEKQHGMFTYYLLKKIRESKGNCTLGELGAYVCDEVAKQAIVTNGKEQTPVILTSVGIKENWKDLKLR